MLEGFSYSRLHNNCNEENYGYLAKLIEEYLKSIGQEKYKRLAIRLLKIDIYKKEERYYRYYNFLERINEKDSFDFLVNKYKKKFYAKRVNHEEKYANLCLDVLLELANLGYINFNEIKHLKEYNDHIEELKKEMAYAKDIKKSLNNMPCVLTRELNPQRVELLKQCLLEEEALSVFPITTELGPRLVVRNLTSMYLDMAALNQNAKKARANNDYKKALDNYFQILTATGVLHYVTYADIGSIYLKMKNPKQAIQYFTIAVYHPDNQKREFQKQLDFLLNSEDIEYERKPQPKVKETEFLNYDTLTARYGKIIDLLIKENMSLTAASQRFSLNNKDILKVKILIARIYFANGFADYAIKMLKQVEQDMANDAKITKLLQTTRANKNLYKNKEEYQKGLRLSLWKD